MSIQPGDRVWLDSDAEMKPRKEHRLTGTVTDSKRGHYWDSSGQHRVVDIDEDQICVNWDGGVQNSIEYIEDLTKVEEEEA